MRLPLALGHPGVPDQPVNPPRTMGSTILQVHQRWPALSACCCPRMPGGQRPPVQKQHPLLQNRMRQLPGWSWKRQPCCRHPPCHPERWSTRIPKLPSGWQPVWTKGRQDGFLLHGQMPDVPRRSMRRVPMRCPHHGCGSSWHVPPGAKPWSRARPGASRRSGGNAGIRQQGAA